MSAIPPTVYRGFPCAFDMNYEELLEKARETYESEDTPHVVKAWLLANIIYPTDESEDERTRKELIEQIAFITPNNDELDDECNVLPTYQKRIDKYRAWLEKQGEQPTDKVESKFKVGDWITDGYIHCKITEVLDDRYIIKSKYCYRSAILFEYENRYHLWTIDDAKDGDVLVAKDGRLFIFTGEFDAQDDNPIAYCGINSVDKFIISNGSHWTFKDGIKPATKEQRDLLFQKMKEAGYEWNDEKKELKKIETHYDIKNFHAGMPVLVRIYNNHKWCYLLFSHCYKHQGILHFSCGGAGWLQCIPFEGNEHLLGTTDMCDEKFINW